ncbi:hypothetical protein FQN57_004836 [Myotisia sp. PD_48]|nr:hypothetical protein FQN57_004836 [Myotisia sp. PD_48]
MASSDSNRDRDWSTTDQSRTRNNSSHNKPEDNPFIDFRRYVDEQVASFLNSIIGLPSAIFPPQRRDWVVFNDEELNNLARHWRSQAEEASESRNARGRGNSNGGYLSSARGKDGEGVFRGDERNSEDGMGRRPDIETRRNLSHSFPASVFDALFDTAWPFGPSIMFRDFSHLQAPFIFDFLSPSTSAGWPISYLMFSPYSPLHLERQQQIRYRHDTHGFSSWFPSSSSEQDNQERKEPCWRDAFEDLLRVENGQPMLERDGDSQPAVRRREPGKDWLSGMIKRGSLGDGWSYVPRKDGEGYFKFNQIAQDKSSTNSRNELTSMTENEADAALTELDLYDNFLRQVNNQAESIRASPLLREIFDERKRHRGELEELQKSWRDVVESHNSRDTKAIEQPDIMDPMKTELDYYEMQSQTSQTTPPTDGDSSSSPISTTTTTQRRIQPDGSIKTKVIVSKRFADGREETIETEEVKNPSNDMGEQKSPNQQQKHRNGWFWKD